MGQNNWEKQSGTLTYVLTEFNDKTIGWNLYCIEDLKYHYYHLESLNNFYSEHRLRVLHNPEEPNELENSFNDRR